MATLQIIVSTDVPDSTYFTTGSAEPDLDSNALTIYDGTGTRRSSWGQPGVTSTIVYQSGDLVSIHVGFFHKHGGGQFWRYYRLTDGRWRQVTWAQLSDEDRQCVLTAYGEHRAPSFAKVPGKLRTEHKKPEMKTMTTYKLVQIIDGRYYSVYDGDTEYVMGKRLAEKAVDEHGGGYYSYPSEQGVEKRFYNGSLFPERCYQQSMQLALIECEISGTILNYQGKKYASTYIRPMRELKQFEYTPALAIA
jgi:hypothetical protein